MFSLLDEVILEAWAREVFFRHSAFLVFLVLAGEGILWSYMVCFQRSFVAIRAVRRIADRKAELEERDAGVPILVPESKARSPSTK